MTHALNNFLLYLLIVSCLIIFIISVVTAWQQGRRSLLTWFMVPFVIFNIGFGWYTVEQLRGWPYHADPAENTELLYGHVTKQYIYLLVDLQDDGPRLYAIDFDAESAKQLQQALEAKQSGHRVMVKSVPMQSLKFYNFRLDQIHQKNPK